MTVHFDLGGDQPCASCQRWLYADGLSLVIEQATGDDEGQALAYLSDLYHAKSKAKRLRFEDVVARFEVYSIYGDLEPKRELRHLEGNVWEIKTPQDRVLFFEIGPTDVHRRAARVTNCCEKRVSVTAEGRLPAHHIRKAQAIERKDQHHGSSN